MNKKKIAYIRLYVWIGLVALSLILLISLIVVGSSKGGLSKKAANLTANNSELATKNAELEKKLNISDAPPYYQELFPDFVGNATFNFADPEEKTAYLTFDIGPTSFTPQILDILSEHEVKATFFIVGSNIEGNEETLNRIIAEGHTIGMRSFSNDMEEIYLSTEAFLTDFNQVFEAVVEVTGEAPTILRFPGSSINGYNSANHQEIISEVLRRGFIYYDWNISAGDGGNRIAAQNVVNNIRNNNDDYHQAHIQLHEKENTVYALDDVITMLVEQGYKFDRLTNEVRPVIFGYPGQS